MYFDKINGDMRFRRRGRGEEAEPGIGIAWFRGDSSREVSELKHFRRLPRLEETPEFSEEALRSYIDLFVMDAEEFEFDRPERSLKNGEIVDFVISEPFVIERSPPSLLTLKGVLTNTNLPIWIGTYMGWSVAPEHSVLLFITVPGGIIVVSSATGLASALAAGLSKSVKRLFNSR
jgi:hypothetical protein